MGFEAVVVYIEYFRATLQLLSKYYIFNDEYQLL